MTCKQGLTESLRRCYQFNTGWYPAEHADPNGLGVDSFFPRTHIITDSESLQDFQRDFVLTAAENYIKTFIKKYNQFSVSVLSQPGGSGKQSASRNTSQIRKSGSLGRISSASPKKSSPKKTPQKAVVQSQDGVIIKPSEVSQDLAPKATPIPAPADAKIGDQT